ncbi:MAG: cupin domain-containing protein [Anaerovoracaceae bacterium]|jgi:ethanolamine utilization protein EutQ
MRKLICAKDVEAIEKEGKKVLHIQCDTIITPSARDLAKATGIEFSTDDCPCCTGTACVPTTWEGVIDSDKIYNLLKAMLDRGMLQGIFDSSDLRPYEEEGDGNGLKIVRGGTVKYERLDTGNPKDRVFYREIINADDGSSMNAGFITIEDSNFDWECECQELYNIVEGTLNLRVNGREFKAYPGDTVFFPRGARIRLGSTGRLKAFYATY